MCLARARLERNHLSADVAFVACCKTKADRPAPAGALYASPLFRKSLQAALDQSRKVFILSAEHGIVNLSTILEPYDTTLKGMNVTKRREWGKRVGSIIGQYAPPGSSVELLCGEEYIAPISLDFGRLEYKLSNRLLGLSLGQRLSKLSILNSEFALRQTKVRFDQALNRLWIAQNGGRLLSETTGRQPWPQRGVYFLLDAQAPAANGRTPRVIRVGTHAVSDGSKTTLWDRISTHRGTSIGGGSHRSSIFRLHVGRALMARSPILAEKGGSTWGRGQSAPKEVRTSEQHIEAAVSATLGAMRLLWIDVPDEASSTSMRSYIEKNAIALLSRIGLLSTYSSQRWLGRYSPEWKIAASGLWNLNYVFSTVEPNFVDVFEEAVDYTIRQNGSTKSDLSAIPAPSLVTDSQFMLFSQEHKIRASVSEPNRSIAEVPKANRTPTRSVKTSKAGSTVRRRDK